MSESHRRAKIIATVGPACQDPTTLAAVISAGADLLRINASHSSADDIRTWGASIDTARRRAGRYASVLVDIQGPKLRVTALPQPLVLQAGQQVTLGAPATHPTIPLDFAVELFDTLPGHRLLIDDGRIALRLDESPTAAVLVAHVERGGTVLPHKGVNLPDSWRSTDLCGAKDLADLQAARDINADWVAASFVAGPDDLDQLRPHIGSASLIAKIERQVALDRFTEIAAAADAVMLARGDLGVETDYTRLGVVQVDMLATCRRLSIPVIVATEVLESMRDSHRPTRAEVSDATWATVSGADAIMLSAETSVGIDPVNTVATLGAIMTSATSLTPTSQLEQLAGATSDPTRVLAAAASLTSAQLQVSTIVVFTETGHAARALAATRPTANIVAVTEHAEVAGSLQLIWGIETLTVPIGDQRLDRVRTALRARTHLDSGELILVLSGQLGCSGTISSLRLETI